MALNKKHKKQLEVIRKKLPQLKQQLAGEKEQQRTSSQTKRESLQLSLLLDVDMSFSQEV